MYVSLFETPVCITIKCFFFRNISNLLVALFNKSTTNINETVFCRHRLEPKTDWLIGIETETEISRSTSQSVFGLRLGLKKVSDWKYASIQSGSWSQRLWPNARLGFFRLQSMSVAKHRFYTEKKYAYNFPFFSQKFDLKKKINIV